MQTIATGLIKNGLLSECTCKLTEMDKIVKMSAVLDPGCANLLIQNILMFTATLKLASQVRVLMKWNSFIRKLL